MAKWRRFEYEIKGNHNWRLTPGYKLMLTEQGAVRFEFPRHWIFEPEENTMKFRDRPHPKDDCLLQVSVLYLPGLRDWSDLPVDKLVADMTDKIESREVLSQGKVITGRRLYLDYAWREARVIDPTEKREIISRSVLARSGLIQLLATMDYYAEFAAKFRPVWDTFLGSIRLGEYLADPSPTRRPLN